ncbi:MAG: glycosyltransferase [Magnetovibrionaceae bacterium]
MKIAQVMAGAPFGGAEAFFVRLVLGLHRAKVDQVVAIRQNADRARLLARGGVTPHQFAFGGAFDFSTKSSLKRLFKAEKPDLVLTWMNRATALCPKSKGKFVHVARLGGYYDLKYYQACDHLVGNTQDIVDYLVKEGWPEEKAHYLPNFVDAEPAAPAERDQWFTPDRSPLVLAMGRLHENKAFDTLLEAIARVPDAYLWLAGDGPEREALERMAEKLAIKPRVRFLGWRDDTAALLAACDVFVCPSRHEPLGNVVVEAWAQGKAVVAADALGPGTLIDHLETGVLFPVDDAKLLADSLKYVLAESADRERLAAAGRRAYEEHFTEARVVDQYMTFFERVIAEQGGK